MIRTDVHEHIRRRVKVAEQLGLRRRRRGRLPKQIIPPNIERDYYRAISKTLAPLAELVQQKLMPELPLILAEADRVYHRDAYGDKITKALEGIRVAYAQRVSDADLKAAAKKTADSTAANQEQQLNRQVKSAIGIDLFHLDPRTRDLLDTFTTQNVALIKTVPQKFFAEVESIVQRGARMGKSQDDIAAEIAHRTKVADSRAQVIARDQVSKLFADVNETRQRSLGITEFVWRTAGDERVRPSHAELDGETFAWSDTPVVDGERATPGNAGVNCRCTAEPVIAL